MKEIVIKIPQELYDRATKGELTEIDSMFICGSTANGVPLEDIKAEIEVEREKNTNGEYDKIFELCLLIINKHIGG